MCSCRILLLVCSLGLSLSAAGFAEAQSADSPKKSRTKRVVLLGQQPDGHPWSTHEYMAGVNIMAACLQNVPGVQTIVAKADEPWNEGPEILDGADAAVMFLSEGGKWLGSNAQRLAAFKRLSKRGGGLVCLHWGMGCKDARYIADYVSLFGGCHGGPDRKYNVVTAKIAFATPDHPVLRGIEPFEIREEFYYRLKFPKDQKAITPLWQVPIEGENHTVAWAFERPNGGRSAGFSGGHFHENWNRPEYRRLMTQSILWTLDLPVPQKGIDVDIPPRILKLAPRQDAKQPSK